MSLGPEGQRADRRQGEGGGEGLAVGFVIPGVDAAKITLVAPAVKAGVAVEDLPPESALRKADAIVVPQHRRQIENNRQLPAAVAVLADK